MPQLVYLSSARQDLRDIFRYLAEESSDRLVARAFVNRLQQQCGKLAALPGTLGRARPELRPDIRSFPYRGYIIFFRYEGTRFEVVKVMEGHRDFPGVFAEG